MLSLNLNEKRNWGVIKFGSKYSNALFKEMPIPLQQCPVLGFSNIPFNLIYGSS